MDGEIISRLKEWDSTVKKFRVLSPVAAKLVGIKGRVVASDILPVDTIAGVEFIASLAFSQVMVWHHTLVQHTEYHQLLLVYHVIDDVAGVWKTQHI